MSVTAEPYIERPAQTNMTSARTSPQSLLSLQARPFQAARLACMPGLARAGSDGSPTPTVERHPYTPPTDPPAAWPAVEACFNQ
jgi:hypothetical protein